MPQVTIHYAQSLDGRLATRTGDSQWIGGQRSLELAHQLRAEHDVVLVGVQTVIADNPRLTVRLVQGPSPRRVVLDSTLRLPLDANVVTDGVAPTTIVTTSAAPPERLDILRNNGADVLVVEPDGDGRVPIERALDAIDAKTVLVEGGGQIITSILKARKAQRLVVCISPLVIGDGTNAINDLGIVALKQALRFKRSSFTLLDDDVIFDGHL